MVNGEPGKWEKPLFPHLIEALVPTNVVMNQRIAEYMVRTTGPVISDANTEKRDEFAYTLQNGKQLVYDYRLVCDYVAERAMKFRAVLVGERVPQENLLEEDRMDNIRVIRTEKRQKNEFASQIPIYTSSSMNANLAAGGVFINRSSVALMAKFTRQIQQMLLARKPILSKYLTTKTIVGNIFHPAFKKTRAHRSGAKKTRSQKIFEIRKFELKNLGAERRFIQ